MYKNAAVFQASGLDVLEVFVWIICNI